MSSSRNSPPRKPRSQSQLEELWAKARPVLEQTWALLVEFYQRSRPVVQEGWRRLLRFVRSILPAEWNAKLSDPVLTAILIGIILLLLWLPSAVAQPPAEESSVSEELPSAIEVPEQLKAPAPPKLELAPDETLIAALQEEAVVPEQAETLVETVQANFRRSRLIVTLSDRWYDLSADRQTALAQALLNRIQTLSFSKLELVDASGKLLARSPVVGSDMVILQRTAPVQAA